MRSSSLVSLGLGVLLGTASTANAACLESIVAPAGASSFGAATLLPGDLNGDGFGDLVVGSTQNGLAPGRAYVYFGAVTPDAVEDLLLTGASNDDQFGSVLCGIGDWNRDGALDLAVGAPYDDNAGTDAGRVYVFFGGSGFDANADIVLAGPAPGAHFGASIAGGRDLNGDGPVDVVVGAPTAAASGSNAGAVYAYFGSPAPDATPDRNFNGETGEQLGSSVALGDVNGDGTADLAAGAPNVTCSHVKVYFGSATLDTTFDRLLTTGCGGTRFGSAVAIGRLDGDAIADVLVGAPRITGPGAAYIFLGVQYAPWLYPDVVLSGSTQAQLGSLVAIGPDLTGDAIDDFIVAAPGAEVRLYAGGPALDAIVDQLWLAETSGTGFGAAAALGQYDADPETELMVGAPAYGQGRVELLAQNVLLPIMLCPPDTSAAPNTNLLRLMRWKNGTNVSLTYNYIVSDDRGWGATQQGTVMLGPSQIGSVAFALTTPATLCTTLIDTVTLEVRRTTCPDRTLTCATGVTCVLPMAVVTCAPDTVVGDGTTMRRMHWTNSADFAAEFEYLITDSQGWGTPVSGASVIGAHQTASAVITLTVPAGCAPQQDVVTLRVNPAICPASASTCNSSVTVPGFATSMSCPPDTLVLDGQASTTTLRWQNVSVYTTAYGYNVADTQGWGAPLSGSVVLAPNQFGTVAYTYVTPALPGGQVESTTFTLDVRETFCSRTYTCTWRAFASSSALPTWVLTNGGTYNGFGTAVAMPGDLNADGRADLAVGINTGAPSDAGHVQVFFGATVFDATADRTMAGEGVGDLFGIVVVPGGDLNQDGFSDLVVGAPGNDAGGLNAGRAYVHFGGPTFDHVIDRILTGTQGFQLGSALAGVGDVNADGTADLLVGMPGAATGSGLAFLYFGGAAFDSNVDRFLFSSSSGEEFGARVARCNDVNGDGRNDFLVGAPGNDQGGTDAGAVYVYFGGPGVDGTADLVLHGDAGRFGDALTAADIDADGFQDIVVGAPLRNPGGRAYVFRGGPGVLDATADWLLDGTVPGGRFGSTLDASGDLDSDTYRDLAVGAPHPDPAAVGRVWLFRGGPAFDAQADRLLLGMPATKFGSALASGTDFTGDSRLEIAVGAPDEGGRVFLYTGLDFTTDTGPVVEPPAAPVTVTALGLPRDRGTGGVWIDYTLDAHAGRAQLEVFDISGRFVRSLVNEARPAGGYVAVWDGRDSRSAPVSRGVYIVRMRAGQFEASRKMVKAR